MKNEIKEVKENSEFVGKEIIRKAIPRMRICDNYLFSKYASNRDCIQELLRAILNKDDLVIVENHAQYHLSNVDKKEGVLDCYAIDAERNRYDIEVQLYDNDDLLNRAIYYSSLMRTTTTDKGTDYKDITKITIIFLCNFGLKNGLPINTLYYYIKETNEVLYNKDRIIFVDMTKIDNSDLGRLMRLLTSEECVKDEKYHYTSAFLEETRENKEKIIAMGQELENYMKSEIEKGRNEGEIKGRNEGKEEGLKEGLKEGIKEGEIKGKEQMVVAFYKDGTITEEMAISKLNVTAEQFNKLLSIY